MFNLFRARAHRDKTQAPHRPPAGVDDGDFGRAWADYVEWSGLDEDRLPGGQGQPER